MGWLKSGPPQRELRRSTAIGWASPGGPRPQAATPAGVYLAVVVLYLIIVLAGFSEIIIGGKVPVSRVHPSDVYMVYTAMHANHRAFASGQLPLWNAGYYGGMAVLGDGLTAPLNPFNLLAFVLPFHSFFLAYMLGHIVLFGFFAFVFFHRGLRLPAAASTVGGMFAMLAPISSAWAFPPWQLDSYSSFCWLPLVLFTFIRTLRRPTLARTLVCGLALSGSLLLSPPMTYLLHAMTLSLFALCWMGLAAWEGEYRRAGRAFLVLAGVGVSSVVFGAATFAPFVESVVNSHRFIFGRVGLEGPPASYLLRGLKHGLMVNRPNLQFLSLFPMLAVFLAVRGLPAVVRDRLGRTVLALMTLELGIAALYLLPGAARALAALPLLRGIDKSYIFYSFDLLLPALAAYGVASLEASSPGWWRGVVRAFDWLLRAWWAYLALFLLAVLVLLLTLPSGEFERAFQVYFRGTPEFASPLIPWARKLFLISHWGIRYESYLFEGHQWLLVAFLASQLALVGWVFWRRGSPGAGALLGASGITAVAFLMFVNHPMLDRSVALGETSPIIPYLQRNLGDHRIYFNQYKYLRHGYKAYPWFRYPREGYADKGGPHLLVNTMYRSLPVNFGLSSFQGQSHFLPFRSKYYHDILNGSSFRQLILAAPASLDTLDTVLYDLAGIKYVVFGEEVGDHPKLKKVVEDEYLVVYENRAVWPRAFLVYEYETVGSPDEAAERLKRPDDGTYRRKAVVESPPEAIGQVRPGSRPGRVTVTRQGVNALELLVETGEPAVLVVSNNYERGWKATVGGARAPLFPAYLAFTGLVVPAGTSRVRLFYRPGSLMAGLAVSALGFAGLALCLLRSRGASRPR